MSDPYRFPALLLVRLASELPTKARRTRKRFQRRLVTNIEDALASAGFEHAVDNRWNRILVGTSDRDAAERVATVFGVSSVSPIDARVPARMERIVERGRELYGEVVKGRRFAVEAHRKGEHDFTSQDIKVELGAALNPGATVDLDHPEVEVEVEVRDDEAFLFATRLPGPGGMPLGVQGTAACLISGGFDSPAAAWLMLKRGVSLEYVFCNLAGGAYERSVAMVTRILVDEWSHGESPRLHVVDFVPVVRAIQDAVTPRYWQVVLKRAMYRAGELVAGETSAEALVTGESLGQVSSQTLGNLRAIDDAAALPVFRPLIGLDKNEIIEIAERAGTAALSARIREYCAILPDRPVTHGKPAAVRSEAARIDEALIRNAVAERTVLKLREMAPADLVEPYVFVDEVPEGATVVDVRPAHRWRDWHHPGAERVHPRELLHSLANRDKEATWVLYCDRGTQTAHLAEVMQRVGFEAYSFRGGTRALQAWLERRAQRV